MKVYNVPWPSLTLHWLSFFSLLMNFHYSSLASSTSTDSGGDMATNFSSSNYPPPSSLPQSPLPLTPERQNVSRSKPSITVLVGALTIMFSITFLVLLYAKHCKRGNGYRDGTLNSRGFVPISARKNSGVDRKIIELLPIFRFGSLLGEKSLECAVCLNMFEPIEVLKLLPKCKHAFHVDCVDTWLDAHSTCPLCRNCVDSEDLLLIDDEIVVHRTDDPPSVEEEPKAIGFRRLSGRHSSAGERGNRHLQVVVESHDPMRRSLDSSSTNPKIKSKQVSIGCLEKTRKDGILLDEGTVADKTRSIGRRFEHRIIVSGTGGLQQRWSDVIPSDLLYLRSEMIISETRGSRQSGSKNEDKNKTSNWGIDDRNRHHGRQCVINARSLSEITGFGRFLNRESNEQQRQRQRHRNALSMSRWVA